MIQLRQVSGKSCWRKQTSKTLEWAFTVLSIGGLIEKNGRMIEGWDSKHKRNKWKCDMCWKKLVPMVAYLMLEKVSVKDTWCWRWMVLENVVVKLILMVFKDVGVVDTWCWRKLVECWRIT